MNRAQLDELHELKRQETKLYIWIRRYTKRNQAGPKRAAMIEQRETLLQRMKPLRDQLLSEIKGAEYRLVAEFIRLYYGGFSCYEVADLFGYPSRETIIGKIREEERQVAGP